jgi:hypothetical protein
VHRNDEVQLFINGQKLTPELEYAVVLSEDDQSITYEIPLRKAGGGREARFDKYQLTAQVNKQRHEFMRAIFRQRSSMRVNLIAKVSEGVTEIEFGSPDPRYPALPIKTTSRATIKIFLGTPHLVQSEAVRTDVKHVTPYDERFGVKLGPIRTIEL